MWVLSPFGVPIFLCIFAGMNVIEINSLDVPEVAVYAHLTEAQLRSRVEPEKGVFIVESAKVIRVALAAGWQPLSFLAERKYIDTQVRELLEGSGEWRRKRTQLKTQKDNETLAIH